jgi:hypothetical protein
MFPPASTCIAVPDTTMPVARRAGQSHPSGDNRFKMLDATMRRHRYLPDALLEVLHAAPELFGYRHPLGHVASPEGLVDLADSSPIGVHLHTW